MIAVLVVRWIAKKDEEPVNVHILDFSMELFAAATAVFPTTLILQSQHKATSFSNSQIGALIVLILAIPFWGRMDARYFSYWRKGEQRVLVNGKLTGSIKAPNARARKWLGFLIGNGLGLAILCISSILSQQVAQ